MRTKRRHKGGRILSAVLLAGYLSVAGAIDLRAQGEEKDAQDGTSGVQTSATTTRRAPAAPLPFEVGGPFTLTDHHGRRVSSADFEGRPAVLVFGYAKCKNMCPLSLRRLAAALDTLGPAARDLQALFVTVNPEEETPAVLRAALAAIDPRLLGLTGTRQEVDAVLAAYKIESAQVGKDFEGDSVISHGSYFYIIGSDGAVKTFLPPIFSGQALAEKIRPYLSAEAGS